MKPWEKRRTDKNKGANLLPYSKKLRFQGAEIKKYGNSPTSLLSLKLLSCVFKIGDSGIVCMGNTVVVQ